MTEILPSPIIYPSTAHEKAAATIVDFWSNNFHVDAVLLVNSCARNKATKDSCLDMNILVRPEVLEPNKPAWEEQWAEFNRTNPDIHALEQVGKYSVVHLDLTDGVFEATEQDEAGPPDSFEVGIGNLLTYSVTLWQKGDYLDQLKEQWLPYYGESLRRQRLEKVIFFCLNNLQHIPLYVDRGLYFQAFDRLYNAYQEFLQALFIVNQTYPIAYNKWIHEQLVEILCLPDLYEQVIHLFEIRPFAGKELTIKAQQLENLLDEYVLDVYNRPQSAS